ncbi:MAG: hypothetical protein U9R04_04780 [Chloroflexota bacterium]|nr:hypothetical protein [Chloroflexota bacterium]
MNKKLFCLLLVIGLLVFGIAMVGCEKEGGGAGKPEGPPKLEGAKPLENAIEIKAEGKILHYQRESFWNSEDFSGILESKKEFEAEESDSFEKALENYDLGVINLEFQVDEARKTSILMGDIKGAVYNTNSYEFHWLLGDLPFDLYQFQQSKKELNYEGEVNGVPTTIRLVFPYTIAHCHEHVWPSKS